MKNPLIWKKYKDYEIVESRNTSNIRANDVGQIKGETGKGMIQASSIYVKKRSVD